MTDAAGASPKHTEMLLRVCKRVWGHRQEGFRGVVVRSGFCGSRAYEVFQGAKQAACIQRWAQLRQLTARNRWPWPYHTERRVALSTVLRTGQPQVGFVLLHYLVHWVD